MPGWALNLSRGGVRAVIDERVELGEVLDVQIEEIEIVRRGKVVWVQDEPDGAIVGIQFDEPIVPPQGVELDNSVDLSRDSADDLGLPGPLPPSTDVERASAVTEVGPSEQDDVPSQALRGAALASGSRPASGSK
jgi:hypothetical protein